MRVGKGDVMDKDKSEFYEMVSSISEEIENDALRYERCLDGDDEE